MRISLVTASLLLLMAPACSRTASFPDGIAEATRQAQALRQGFESVAPVDLPEKAKRLAPSAEHTGPALVTLLEALSPSAEQALCHADALAGARRSVGAMKDLLAIYRSGQNSDAIGARAIAAARSIDQGLVTLETALADCSK